jgi:3-oxoacyl-[acyl-carrier protein] reductase
MSLENKVALVTGATRGIGQAVALELAKAGASVVATATSAEGVERIKQTFKDAGLNVLACVLNVCDGDSIEQLLEHIVAEKGSAPAILVNNAAITRDNILLRMKAEQWDEVINTNLNAVFRVTKACLKPMVKARFGRVITISSVVAFTGNFGQANYTAAKAGVVAFTKTMAQELAGYGITANCVAPGFIDTDMTRQLTEKQQQMISEKIPMGHVGQPEDIAYAVAFLASEQAKYVTGSTLHVNGGMFMA